MNVLDAAPGGEPAGAAALLGLGDPEELTRFGFLEDRIWDATTLRAGVIEAARLRSARIRGCEFCASVRMSAAVEDGLTEEGLAHIDEVAARADLPLDQQAALRLVDAFLLDAAPPTAAEQTWLVEVLGAAGIVEVLVACSVNASADLRIALGDNRAASNSAIARDHGSRPRPDLPPTWPALRESVLLPDGVIPHVDPRIDEAVRGFRTKLYSQTDVSEELLAACIVRCAQVLGVDVDSDLGTLLAPVELRGGVQAEDVRSWDRTFAGQDRDVLAYAEQLWLDPSGLDAALVEPVRSALGLEGLIRFTWNLIWIAQLQRLTLVLGGSTIEAGSR